MALLMDLSMYTAAISAALLFILIVIYSRIYRDTRSRFSLGLVIFALAFFVENTLAVYSFLTMSSFIGDPYLPFLVTINLIQVIGVLVLLRTTMQ